MGRGASHAWSVSWQPPGQTAAWPSVTCSRVIFSLSFSLKPGINILGVKGGCGAGGRVTGDRSGRATAKATLLGRRNPQGSFSTMWLQRKSCQAMIRGKWSHFLASCFIQVEKSPHFLACACFPFPLTNSDVRRIATSLASRGVLSSAVGVSLPPSLLRPLPLPSPSLTLQCAPTPPPARERPSASLPQGFLRPLEPAPCALDGLEVLQY